MSGIVVILFIFLIVVVALLAVRARGVRAGEPVEFRGRDGQIRQGVSLGRSGRRVRVRVDDGQEFEIPLTKARLPRQ